MPYRTAPMKITLELTPQELVYAIETALRHDPAFFDTYVTFKGPIPENAKMSVITPLDDGRYQPRIVLRKDDTETSILKFEWNSHD